MATTNRQYDDTKIVAAVQDLEAEKVVDHVLEDVQVIFDPSAPVETATARVTVLQSWTVSAVDADAILNDATLH